MFEFRSIVAVLVCASLFGAGCDRVESPKPVVPDPAAAEMLEQLKVLGYVAWDEEADPMLAGVTRHDPGRTADGFNLYTNDVDEIHLLDLEGEPVHSWKVPESVLGGQPGHCEDAKLLEDGRLLVVCTGHAVILLDWDSTVLLQAAGPMHHDATMLEDGSLLLVTAAVNRRYRRRHTVFDALTRVWPDGEVQRVWFSFDQRRKLREHHPASPLDIPLPRSEEENPAPYDYYHLNSLQILPDTELGRRDPRFRAGNWLLCLRNVDMLIVLDQGDQRITWSYGPGELDRPHMPRMLENGRILIFDNGTRRGFSRVVELDPATGEFAWQYQSDPPEAFFSKWRGAAQRLENGNTLITESERGRVFEVTSAGEVVWEFWNPDIQDDRRRRIYRFRRVPRSWVEPHLSGARP